MGRIPGIASASAAAVVMPHHGSTIAMARPTPTRRIAARDEGAIGIAAGEDVVSRGSHARAGLGEHRIRREIGALTVEFLDACRDLHSVRVDPRTPADPVSRVDR